MDELSNNAPRYRRMVKQTVAATVIVSLLAGCSLLPREEEALAPPLVKPQQQTLSTIDVARGDIHTFLRGIATFTSSRTEPLFFKESGGRIKNVHVKLGDRVEPGQLIIELDTGDLELRARLQKLSVERAEILYSQARASGASGSDLRLRQIDLERERITLESLEDQIKRSRLVSPIGGLVTHLADIKTGEYVNGFQPLATVSDPSEVRMTYTASTAKDLLPIQANMEGTARIEGKEYEVVVLQAPSSAPVTLDKQVQEKNAVTLILGFKEPVTDVEIQIGKSAEFEIPLEIREDVIVLPRSGVRNYLGREYVQVLEGERRKEVDVEVGLRTPTQVEIVRGLEEGQQIILNN